MSAKGKLTLRVDLSSTAGTCKHLCLFLFLRAGKHEGVSSATLPFSSIPEKYIICHTQLWENMGL